MVNKISLNASRTHPILLQFTSATKTQTTSFTSSKDETMRDETFRTIAYYSANKAGNIL